MAIVCGIDAHDKQLVCRIWRSDGKEATRRAMNSESGRAILWSYLEDLRQEPPTQEVIVGYEACGLGYRIYDEARAAGYRCYVLATTKIAKSVVDSRRKTDEYDAQKINELLRAHVLAGLELPSVWVPGVDLRDDRELVRRRFDVKADSTRVKNQIHGLLKRHAIKKPEDIGSLWMKPFMSWLKELKLSGGARTHLDSLLWELQSLLEDVKRLDKAVEVLAETPRYERQIASLVELKGVGLLTAMVFLVELGDLSRFPNRRALKSYVGLAPSSHESGEVKDRKGHIMRNGPSRLRAILNQAAWVRIAHDSDEADWFMGYCNKHSGGKKKAIVICMSRLVLVMWHRALQAQREWERLAA